LSAAVPVDATWPGPAKAAYCDHQVTGPRCRYPRWEHRRRFTSNPGGDDLPGARPHRCRPAIPHCHQHHL